MAEVDLILLHAGLMVVGFGIFCPLSVAVAKIGRGRWILPKWVLGRSTILKEWFNLHVGMHLAAILSAIVAVLVLVFGLPADFSHFSSYHSWFGLVLLAGVAFVQPTLGLNEDSGASRQRAFQQHKQLGQLLAVLLVANIAFGFAVW